MKHEEIKKGKNAVRGYCQKDATLACVAVSGSNHNSCEKPVNLNYCEKEINLKTSKGRAAYNDIDYAQNVCCGEGALSMSEGKGVGGPSGVKVCNKDGVSLCNEKGEQLVT